MYDLASYYFHNTNIIILNRCNALCLMACFSTARYVDLQKSSYLQKGIKYFLVTACVYVRNTFNYQNNSRNRFFETVHVNLEPQGYKVRDSNYFTCA